MGVSPNAAPKKEKGQTLASGGSFPAGDMQPHAELAVSSSPVTEDAAAAAAADMVVFSVCEEDCAKLADDDAVFEGVAPGLGALVKELVDEKAFKGKAGSTAFTRVPKATGLPFRHVGLVGVGDPAKTATSPEVWIGFGREAAKAACEAKCASLYLRKYWMGDTAEAFRSKAASIVLGAYLGSSADVRFKSEPEPPTLKTVTVSSPRAPTRPASPTRAGGGRRDRLRRDAHQAARGRAPQRGHADGAGGDRV